MQNARPASEKSISTAQSLEAETFPVNYIPSSDQVNTLAKLLAPEIKKFFADERTQKEFIEWKERHKVA